MTKLRRVAALFAAWLLALGVAALANGDGTAIARDFERLYEANGNVVGWLTAGASIDYPVVQFDNEFYLNHNFFNRLDNNGTLFLNMSNILSPRDDVLIIHGHNMRSGAMFGDLDDFESFKFARAHPIVKFRTIYDDGADYVPISVFSASMNPDDPGYFDITGLTFDDDTYRTYLDGLRARSEWRSPASVDVGDELLLLVTCNYSRANGRLILACRKLRSNETTADIAAMFR